MRLKLSKKKIVFISGILVSFACLWLFVRKVEWDSLSRAFSEADYIYVLPAILCIFASYLVRAVRWSYLIAPVKRVSLLSLFSAIMVGFMANSVLPARAGELIRPILIGKKENIKIATSLATVVMERIFDMMALIIFAAVILFIIPSNTSSGKHDSTVNQADVSAEKPGNASETHIQETDTPDSSDKKKAPSSIIKQLKRWSAIMAFIGIFAIASLFALAIYPEKVSVIIEKLIFFLPHNLKDKLINLLHSFMAGLQILESRKQLVRIGILSLFIWLFNAVPVYILAFSFKIELSFVGSCFVIICIALAVALPQAPGFIGVFHIATQKSLEIFGVGLSLAQSYAILLWAITVIPTVLAGIWFLWREGIRLGEIAKQESTL